METYTNLPHPSSLPNRNPRRTRAALERCKSNQFCKNSTGSGRKGRRRDKERRQEGMLGSNQLLDRYSRYQTSSCRWVLIARQRESYSDVEALRRGWDPLLGWVDQCVSHFGWAKFETGRSMQSN
jgi:hypothetical protein